MAGLLWDTGEPLNRLVRDAIRGFGFEADLTEAGATYDVSARLTGGRLLIEVTGIEGHLTKASKKIAQVLNLWQTEAKPGDRVAIALNAYREQPLAAQQPLAPLTPDALALLTGLGAIVFTTGDLFKLWRLSLTDMDRARQRSNGLLSATAGSVQLT